MGFGTINSGGAKPQDLSGYLKTEQLGKAGGVAPLDEQAKIILDYLYTNAANALAKLDANGKLPTDLIPALSAYIAASAKGAANGVASLDANGKLPSGQLTSHAHAYSSLTGVPSTFPPASHSHAASEISGLETYLAGLGCGKIAVYEYSGNDVGVIEAEDGALDVITEATYRTITLPFSPSVVFVWIDSDDNILYPIKEGDTSGDVFGSKCPFGISLNGNTVKVAGKFYVYQSGTLYRNWTSPLNIAGKTYKLILIQ